MASDIRFEDASSYCVDLVEKVREEHFEHLEGAQMKVVFDLKKRTSGGKYVTGRMQKANDLIRFLTENNENPEGYDYVMYLDKNVFEILHEPDRKRLIYHELCHCYVDPEKEDCWRIKTHDIETFYDEIEYNQDDPRWGERMGEIASSIYDGDI